MSFVKKAVKKVFKVVKKVGKVVKKVVKSKWFKIAAVVGLSLFTAGIAAGGFAAFQGAMAAAEGGIAGFFSAVGTTISAGLSTVTGGLMGTGWATAAPITSAAQATALANAGAQGGGILGSSAAGVGIDIGASGAGVFSAASQANALTAAAANMGVGTAGAGVAGLTNMSSALGALGTYGSKAAPKGIISRILSPLLEDSVRGSMLRTGIMAGVSGYLRGREMDREEYYRKNKTVYGGKAFGGSGEGIELLSPTRAFVDTPSVGRQVFEGPGSINPALGPPQQPAPGGLFGQTPQGAAQAPQMAQQQAPAQQGPGLLAPSPGVPGQQTQPPPATQPQQGRPPGGVLLENERMV